MLTSSKFLSICLILVVTGLSLSCEQSTKIRGQKPVVQTYISKEKKIHSIPNTGIEFEYTLGKTRSFGDNFTVEISYTVTNNSDHDFHYLTSSCNGLDYHLVTDLDDYKIFPYIMCNATYPIILPLKKGESLNGKVEILKFKESDQIKQVGLDFIAVDHFIPFDTIKKYPELVEELYGAKTVTSNIVWGK